MVVDRWENLSKLLIKTVYALKIIGILSNTPQAHPVRFFEVG